MPDYGHIYADKKISEVNRLLKKTYRQAQAEMKQKLKDFNSRYAQRSKQYKRLVDEGKMSEQDYKNWLTGQVFVRQNWQNKIDQVNKILYDHNAQATKLINNGKLDTFAENYNYQAYLAEGKMVASFTLYNAEAVARLLLDDPQLLPEWNIDKKKDYEWNQKKVNNIVTQGIIQGMSVPEITNRLCEGLATQNDDRMRTFARTAMTGAENAGRQRQMNDAADMGIEVHKKWEATHDNRTRDSHRALDGEEVPYNEDFSNGLEYPGDPAGDPAEVYNCRCTMVTIYPKYEDREAAARRYEEMEVEGQSYKDWKKFDSYEDWKRWKTEKQNRIAQGEDITGTWKRRADLFNFEIEDVINAQGFDGLPTIVSEAEFSKLVQESGMFCKRVYSAESDEIVKAYQQSLYNGKWYVDCSEGGSAFGKGMYCACSYDSKETKEVASTMASYAGVRNIVETFTIRPGSKTITSEALSEMMGREQKAVTDKFTDRGSYAAAKGYDAIIECGRRRYMVILNRTACVFKEGATVQDYEAIRDYWYDFGREKP